MGRYITLARVHESVEAAVSRMNETLEGISPDRIVSITQSTAADSGPGYARWEMTTMIVIRRGDPIDSSSSEHGAGREPTRHFDTVFDVILTGVEGEKVPVIKLVRAHTGLGLKEAKALVDSPPRPIVLGVSKEVAERLKAGLLTAGATAELRQYQA